MKERELRKNTVCSLCGKKILTAGFLMFWRVTIERFGIDAGPIMLQTGLTMFLGKNAVIEVKPVMDGLLLTVCKTCGKMANRCIAELAKQGCAARTA